MTLYDAWKNFIAEHYPTFGDPGREIQNAYTEGYAAALRGLETPEYEYGVAVYGDLEDVIVYSGEHDAEAHVDKSYGDIVVHRRKADEWKPVESAYEYAALYPGYTVPNVATHTDGEAEARAIVRGWGAGKVVRRLPGGEWKEY